MGGGLVEQLLIDCESGVLLYMPHSGTRGQTGHYRHANNIYGPPGPLPWAEQHQVSAAENLHSVLQDPLVLR